jgi:hypothetical protein
VLLPSLHRSTNAKRSSTPDNKNKGLARALLAMHKSYMTSRLKAKDDATRHTWLNAQGRERHSTFEHGGRRDQVSISFLGRLEKILSNLECEGYRIYIPDLSSTVYNPKDGKPLEAFPSNH